MDNKERAEMWRPIADCYESFGTYSVAAADARRRADRLDPPKPEWFSADARVFRAYAGALEVEAGDA